MSTTKHLAGTRLLCLLLLLLGAAQVKAQIPAVLTDRIYQGSGTINLLKDVSSSALQSYLQNSGIARLGVDLNENLAGGENRDSIGVAIKNVELVITTTDGTFSFRDLWTSTTAMIQEQGQAAPQEFYTLFGRAGSSTLNGGTFANMEDVLEIRNVAFTGTLLSAQLNVSLLRTANTTVDGNESFFDFSDGPEQFALVDASTAQAIEAAAAGIDAAPATVTYTAAPAAAAAPATPSPPLMVLAGMAGLLILRARRK